jgi:hypothetical protein
VSASEFVSVPENRRAQEIASPGQEEREWDLETPAIFFATFTILTEVGDLPTTLTRKTRNKFGAALRIEPMNEGFADRLGFPRSKRHRITPINIG